MDKKQIAANLADQLRELADVVDRVAKGDEQAKVLLGSYVDNYWHALVIGNSRECDVQKLLSEDDEQ